MGKKSKKSSKAAEPELSKKERKRLAAEAEALAAAIAEREAAEAKAAKKAAKKGKGKKAKGEKTPKPTPAADRAAASPKTETVAEETMSADDLAVAAVIAEGNEATLAAAEKVLADPNASDGAKAKAAKAKGKVLEGMSDADLKARVVAKKAAREALVEEGAGIDRSDEAAVRDFNERMAAAGFGAFITSDAERERARFDDEKIDAARQEVEPVETEEGTIYAAGTPAADLPIALPSDAPTVDFETNGNGQYKVKRPDDEKIVGYTRTTTYIDCLEDRTNLEKWGKRTLLEGAAIAEVEDDEHVLVHVREVMHRRDVAIAKAHKADRKGRLDVGELASYVAAAEKEAKDALNDLARRMVDRSGANDKREHGTHLHSLVEVCNEHGIERIREWAEATGNDGIVEAGSDAMVVTPADLADLEAYDAAMKAAGLRVVETETTIVVDDRKVAGRLDSIVLHKPEGAARATRKVGDVKTGRVDYSMGKIAMQMRTYADGLRYDLETGERTRLGASKTEGILIHLPAGTGTCTIYPVDLTLGARGIKLAGEVRAWRREGKAAIDFKNPIASAGPKVEA